MGLAVGPEDPPKSGAEGDTPFDDAMGPGGPLGWGTELPYPYEPIDPCGAGGSNASSGGFFITRANRASSDSAASSPGLRVGAFTYGDGVSC